jgi:co-chaperonin GroES (HSP10)
MESSYLFQAHKIKKLTPLHDGVIVSDMNFEERKTSSGLVIVSDDGKNSGIRPRWGKVYAVGSEQKEIKVGQYVLVAHGRWTRGIRIEDEHGEHIVRRVDNNDILALSDEPVMDETMGDKTI